MKVNVFWIGLLVGFAAYGVGKDGVVVPPKTNPLYYTTAIDAINRGGYLNISGKIQQTGTNVCPKAVLLTVRFLDSSAKCCGVGELPRTSVISTEPGFAYLPSQNGEMRFAQKVSIPTNAVSAEIGFCAWSNPLPLSIADVKYVAHPPPGFMPIRGKDSVSVVLPPKKEPLCYLIPIDPDNVKGDLTVSGEILQDCANVYPKAALLMIRFLDASTNCCGVGGLPRTLALPTNPGYAYLSARKSSTRFEHEMPIPTNAVSVEVGFCSWSVQGPLCLRGVEFHMRPPLENTLIVQGLSWCVRHYVVTGIALVCILCLCLACFCWQYLRAKSISAWLNVIAFGSVLLAGVALSYAVTDFLEGLVLILLLGLIIAVVKRLSRCSAREAFVAVFSIGVILRLVAAFAMEMTPFSDFLSFWNQIINWSELRFVGTKSYPMVALYSPLIGLFGANYVVVGITNSIMGALQIWLTKDVAWRIFKNQQSGILASAAIALNPILIIITPVVASEILYGTLILFSFWLFMLLYDECATFCKSKVVSLSVAVGFVSMLTMYARGNGAGIVPAGCCMLLLLSLRLRQVWLFVRYVFVPIAIVCVVMVGAMCIITSKTIGYVCPTGSNHQKWVYLQGSNIEYQGDGTVPDDRLVRKLYSKKYPGKPFVQKDADPIIMALFRRRWFENTAGEVALSLKKHLWVSRSSGVWAYWVNNNKALPHSPMRSLLERGVHVPRSALVLLFIIGSIGLLFRRCYNPAERALAVMLFFLFNVAMTFVTVWTARYSYTMWIVLPIMASVFMTLFDRQEKIVLHGGFHENE